MKNEKNLEIERKFLIKYPDTAILECVKGAKKIDITQAYTACGARLRRWQDGDRVSYIKTVKTHITDLTRIEIENEITREEYETLLKEETSSLKKTRYRIPFEGHLLEIDIFPFWKNQAFLEIELQSEEETFSIPEYITVIKEVTEDKAYRNYALSKKIPKEEIF